MEKIYRMVTKEEKSKIGKKSRIDGAKFELVVRLELEKNGWIVIKNPNNVIEDKDNIKHFKQGKSKYNPFTKRLMMNSGGFPDFICYRIKNSIFSFEFEQDTPEKFCFKLWNSGKISRVGCAEDSNDKGTEDYEIIGVESKINGYLDKEEREKCEWILEKKIFSKILVASKVKNGRKVGVKYETFEKDN